MKNLSFVLMFVICFALGCAHNKPVASSSLTSEGPTVGQGQETGTSAQREPSLQEDTEEEANDKDLDFLDEEEDYEEVEVIADPLYTWNKGMYHFNDKLYFWVLKPVAKGYKRVTPEVARRGVKNFFYNLMFPIRLVSSILQANGDKAAGEVSRFVLNTTAGVLGFGNPAKDHEPLNPSAEDLGQTFGKWGIGNGFYIVWPFLGPSTARDSVGLVGDYFLNPITYVEPWYLSMGIRAYEVVNETSFRIGDYEALKEAAIDPYVSLRHAYVENRKKKVEE